MNKSNANDSGYWNYHFALGIHWGSMMRVFDFAAAARPSSHFSWLLRGQVSISFATGVRYSGVV